jgi:hypothetical protein
MKGLLIAFAALVLGTGSLAHAKEEAVPAEALAGFEAVDSFTAFRGFHSFTVLDDRTLIVWATAFKPYLVELKFPSHDLRWAHAIGVTQFGSRVHAGFDSVQVRGFRYPIDGIYKLTREEAKELTRSI